MKPMRLITVMPSASRLTGSLRDIGYDFWSAVADIVDNSIAALATSVEIEIEFNGASSKVMISDDGVGMGPGAVNEALRFGSRQTYAAGDLGRYGLGLKTASLSQSRRLTVASRRDGGARVCVRQLDLDVIEDYDEWVVLEPVSSSVTTRAKGLLRERPGTVVVWENLDRVIEAAGTSAAWATRRLDALISRTEQHLSMVFHRFLDPDDSARNVSITLNGDKLRPWDPFGRAELDTKSLPPQVFELSHRGSIGQVRLDRYVLPNKDRFSSAEEFERMSGPLKWNRQQGIYIFRADRLVQWGGWGGVRAIDEHTKLARVALSFDTELDDLFSINVSKMRATVPSQLKTMLERPVNEVCSVAQAVYRGGDGHREPGSRSEPRASSGVPASAASGLALRSAALQSGDYDALRRITLILLDQAPEIVDQLGLRDL